MLFDLFLDMLCALGIMLLAGGIAISFLIVIFIVAYTIKEGIHILRESNGRKRDD